MLSSNQQTVLDFYEVALNRKDFEGARRLLGPSYRQHNPRIADGVDGFQAFLRDIREQFPKLRAEVKRMFEDGDHVIAHTHGTRVPGQPGTAIVDIFRFEHGKIVEHWDVMQPISDEAANQNGVF